MENLDHNKIKESTKSLENSRPSFEIDKVEAVQIAEELSIISNAIDHNSPIRVEDLDSFNGLAKNTKINVGGEMMTVEEAEKIPDLKMNTKIWKEMSEGNFDNTSKLTRITPRVSKYLKASYVINLSGLTSVDGLVLPRVLRNSLLLNGLKSAEGLVFPRSVDGVIFLQSLTTIVGLELPDSCSMGISFGSLDNSQLEEIRKKFPQYIQNISN